MLLLCLGGSWSATALEEDSDEVDESESIKSYFKTTVSKIAVNA